MAYEFNGTSQYIEATAPVTAYPFTFACWGRSTSASAAQAAVALCNSSNGHRDMLAWMGSVAGDPVSALTTTSFNTQVDSASGYSTSTWVHGAAVFTSTTSRSAAINGSVTAATTGATIVTGITSLLIGARLAPAVGAYFAGQIAEVGIWTVALSADEIAALGKGFAPNLIRPQSLVFYAPLVRDALDWKGRSLSVTGATVSTVGHPRIFR